MTFTDWLDKEMELYKREQKIRKKFYRVHLALECDYDIEAGSAQEAVERADGLWARCIPHTIVREIEV